MIESVFLFQSASKSNQHIYPQRDDIKLKDKARNLDLISTSTRKAPARKSGSAVVEGRRIKERPRMQRKRKRTVRWTEEEVDLLKRGVRDFGRNWEDIWQRMPVLKEQRRSDVARHV